MSPAGMKGAALLPGEDDLIDLNACDGSGGSGDVEGGGGVDCSGGGGGHGGHGGGIEVV